MTPDEDQILSFVVRGIAPVLQEWAGGVETRLATLEAQLATAVRPLPPVTIKPRVRAFGSWERRPYRTDDVVVRGGKAYRALCDHFSMLPPDDPGSADCWRAE